MTDGPPNEQDGIVRPAPTTLAGLLEELRWPALLHAPRLALRPDRLGLGAIGVLVITLLGTLPALWGAGPGLVPMLVDAKIRALREVVLGLLSLDAARIADGSLLLGELPARLWAQYPAGLIALSIPIILAWAIVGGAISRSAACDHAQGVHLDWPRALGFGLTRWLGLTLALVAPLILAGAIAGGLVLGGGALFALPGLNLLGGLLYGLMLLAGALAVLTLVIWTLAAAMLVPAIACEGTDAVDAVQRAFNYAITRPLRLAVYLALALVVGVLAVGIAAMLARASVGLTAAAGGALLGPEARRVLEAEASGGLAGGASFLVGLWSAIPMLLVAGYAVSYFFSASTLVYLLMRRVVDGQGEHEIWMPGLIEGTLAEAFESGSARAIKGDPPGAQPDATSERDAEPEHE